MKKEPERYIYDEQESQDQKLAKVNDLWYFVKSKENRWILGSGH